MWANISAIIQLIPKILDLLNRLGAYVKTNELDVWVSDLEKSVNALEKSKTPEEKRAVARDFVGLIRRL